MNITDNVLSQKLFDDLYYNITETDFPWYLQNTGVSVEGDGSFQFTHQFCNQLGNRSPFDFLMKPMYYRLGVNKLYRCKMNLTMKTKKTYEFLPFILTLVLLMVVRSLITILLSFISIQIMDILCLRMVLRLTVLQTEW